MSFYDLPGPGDMETWGPCTGHPRDPRTPDDFDAKFEADAIIAEATTADGASDLANDLDADAMDKLVQVIAIACVTQSCDQVNADLGSTVRAWLIDQAELIAITRNKEGRPC